MRKFAALLITTLVVGCSADEPNDNYDIDPRLEAEIAAGEAPDAVVFIEEGSADELRSFVEREGAQVDVFPELGLANLYAVTDVEFVRELFRLGYIKRADADEIYYPISSGAALDLIEQPKATSSGHVGSGVAVAVLDSGLDYTHADFGACSAPGTPGCRVAHVSDFAPDDSQLDDNGRHGSNVASIVASVAPDAKLIGLDIFDGKVARSTDVVQAMSWVVQNASVHDIKVVNLSIGGSTAYTGACDNTSLSVAIQGVAAAGITVVSAAGNDGYKDSMTSPGCASDAIAVGAVYPAQRPKVVYEMCEDSSPVADLVTCFSNSSPELDIVAPGVAIPGADRVMTGTSQATPHVAGAAAVLHGANKNATPSMIRAALTASTDVVTDPGNGASYPRLNMDQSLVSLLGPAPSPAPAPTPAPKPAPQPEPQPEPQPTCEPTVSVAGAAGIDAEGAVLEATVDVSAECPWDLTSSADWFFAATPSGVGPQTVEIVVLENLGAERSADLKLGTSTVQLTQSIGTSDPNYVLIDGGLPRTSANTVTIDIHTEYGDRSSAVCVSTTTSCVDWVPWSAQVTAQIPAVPGSHEVTVWVMPPGGLPYAIRLTDEIDFAP